MKKAPRRALVLVNEAGSRAARDLEGGLRILRAAGWELALERPDDPSEIPARIRAGAPGRDAIVIGGGDGTVSRAVEALLAAKLPLGILPLGTANDLARTLGIPPDAEGACRVIADGRLREIDVGRVDGVPFLNGAAVGWSVRAARRLAARSKRRWGALSYPLEMARALGDRRSFRATVTGDDGVAHGLRSIQIHVVNGRHYGGGMTADADAEPDDGRLVLTSVPPRSILGLLRVVPALRRGRHREDAPAEVLYGSGFEIRTPRPHEVSTDGELAGAATPARIDQLRRALAVYAPEGGAGDPMDEGQGGRSWTRDEREAALNDLLRLCAATADHYADAAGRLADTAVGRLFRRLETERRHGASRLEALVRAQGDLPREPDPDAESLHRLVERVRAVVASDEERALLEARLAEEESLGRAIARARDLDLPPEILRALAELEAAWRDDRERLREALARSDAS